MALWLPSVRDELNTDDNDFFCFLMSLTPIDNDIPGGPQHSLFLRGECTEAILPAAAWTWTQGEASNDEALGAGSSV